MREQSAFNRMVTLERQAMPEPMNFACREALHPSEVTYCREPEKLAEFARRKMAHRLANFLLDHLQAFVVPDPASRGTVFQMELTISDRAAYENWLPAAREEGRKAGFSSGVKSALVTVPYGVEPGLYYE